MKKKFEVPYNFDESLIAFYGKYAAFINYLYLPPFKEDSTNTRTIFETNKKGHCYMPQTRQEYEMHLSKIVGAGLRFVVLWQEPNHIISTEMLNYYRKIGTSGFIVANDKNAKIIKNYSSNLLVIGSLVQHICANVTKRDFTDYDYVVLYYPFNRALDALKELAFMKEKIVLMPNTLCHVDCSSTLHWFPNKEHTFVQKRDCMILNGTANSLDYCGFISPKHLCHFDNFVGGYKLQGREYSTDLLKYICKIYFNRESPNLLLDGLLGGELSNILKKRLDSIPEDQYYNIKSEVLKEKL